MSGPNYRYIPNSASGGKTIMVNGRQVSVSNASYLDMQYETIPGHADGAITIGPVGTTINRPANASAGQYYIDTTLSKVVFSDGSGKWYDPFTGGAV